MAIAIPVFMLLALVLLGGLAAVVYGIVYAIANKRPEAALGSVIAPVAAIIGVALLAMMYWRSQTTVHVAAVEPVHVHWAAQPSMPAMPAIPPIPPMPNLADQPNPLAIDPDLSLWLMLLVALVVGGLYFAFSGKRRSCDSRRRFGWGKAIVGVVLGIVLLNYLLFSVTIFSHDHVEWNQADSMRAAEEHVRQARDHARHQIEEAKRAAEEATKMSAAAQVNGANFQEMLEKLNAPRIKLENSAQVTNLTVAAQTSAAAEISTADGETKLVVPISGETQQSLARSAARLEQMIEQVSVMADQVSDVGTLLGRAMVALNERIDSRAKVPSESLAPSAAVVVAAPVQVEEQTQHVATSTLESERPVSDDLPGKINLGDLASNTIEIKVDRKKLDQIGLTFERLKEILSREGLWHGTVVRFDADKLQISTKGRFENGYVPKLLNTLILTYGRQRMPIHLRDVAEVNPHQPMPVSNDKDSTRPAWIGEPPHQVGNNWQEVVVTEEYSTPEECARAADVYLLLKTYDHLMQLLGNPRSDASMPVLSFDVEGGAIAANGKVIYEKHGNYGNWLDDRIRTLADMGIGIDFVRSEMVPQDGEYYETLERSFGPMKKLYTKFELRPNVRDELRRRWDELRRGERFAVVGAGAGSVLSLLGLAFGLLKVDTWTKGYYTKRLFLGVPAAIIGVLALLGLAAG